MGIKINREKIRKYAPITGKVILIIATSVCACWAGWFGASAGIINAAICLTPIVSEFKNLKNG